MTTKETSTNKTTTNQKKVLNKPACNPNPKPDNGSKTKCMAPKPIAKPASDRPSATDKPSTRMIQFSYFAPQANQVSLAGDFNNWNPNACALTRSSNGEWIASLKLKPGTYDYRFFVDGQWREDPKSTQRVPNAFGSQNDRIIVK